MAKKCEKYEKFELATPKATGEPTAAGEKGTPELEALLRIEALLRTIAGRTGGGY